MSHARAFDLAKTPIEPGMTLIEASAGTGKTYCLAGLVVRLLVERKVDAIGQILVVTFTNAAADELQTRIREALRQAREQLSKPEMAPDAEPYLAELHQRYGKDAAISLREALLAFDDLAVATIHGFCKQVLEGHAFESGLPFDPELAEDDEAMLRSAAEDLWRRRLYQPGREADLLCALAAARGFTPETFLGDYREMHRHPGTRLLPNPPKVADALQAFELELATLGPALDPASLRLGLSRLRFQNAAAASHSRGRLDALVGEAEALWGDESGGGNLAALPALGELRFSSLVKVVEKESRPALENLDFPAACDRLWERIADVEHALRGEILDELDLRIHAIKERDAVFAFDDLLRRLHAALHDEKAGERLAGAVRRRFSVALIDEFQDTDLIQYQIFRRLFAGRPLFLIGDPKQAIYRFRGADVFAYLAAKKAADRAYTLGRNWRSEARLVEAVNQLFSSRPHPFVFHQINYPQVAAADATAGRRLTGDAGIPFLWHWLDLDANTEQVEAAVLEWLGRAVVAQLTAGYELVAGEKRRPLEAGDLAVLVRTNGEANAVREALARCGVPAIVSRSGDIFATEQMLELERIVAAIVDPSHPQKLRAASATLFFGDQAADLLNLATSDTLWQERVQIFENLRDRWQHAGFMAAMQDLLRQRDVRRRFLAMKDGERRLTNWQHAVEVLHQAIHEKQLQPTGALAWLRTERASNTHARDTSELRLESDAKAVKIVTVHKSKGLEYEVVFCPFLWRTQRADRLPVLAHVDRGEGVVYDFGSPDLEKHRLLAEAERLSEDGRLLYVALTRARHRCHVLWGRLGQKRRAAATALAFLLHAAQTPLELGEDAILQASAGVDGLFDEIEGRSELWKADLEKLVRRAPESMVLLNVDAGAEIELPAAPPPEEAPRTYELPAGLEKRLEPWRITSFSSLARGGTGADSKPEPALIPEPRTPAVTSAVTAEPTPPAAEPAAIEDYLDPSWPTPRSQQKPVGLFAFARGTRAGTALHEILEEVDFAADFAADPGGRNAELVRHILWRHGIAEARHHEGGELYDPIAAVLEMLDRLKRCGLPGGEELFSLAELDRRQMLIEWEFHLPLDPLRGSGLARIFDNFADELPKGYARRVESLGNRPLRGFLKGFVDLVFGHRGRFYLVDWKSNHLGNQPTDYPLPALELAMVEHHYVLQYLLYTVALCRHLRASLPDYNYDQHFGGIHYLFLRGLSPGIPADLFAPGATLTGLYSSRPSRELIAALDLAITDRDFEEELE